MKKKNDVKERESSDSKNPRVIDRFFIKNGEKTLETHKDDMKFELKHQEIKKVQEKYKLNIITKKRDQNLALNSSNSSNTESQIVPLNIQEQIERIILKILYDQKSVKSLKELTEKTLERAAKERITISEKPITMIIHQMNKEEKIQFTQKHGWKIRI